MRITETGKQERKRNGKKKMKAQENEKNRWGDERKEKRKRDKKKQKREKGSKPDERRQSEMRKNKLGIRNERGNMKR